MNILRQAISLLLIFTLLLISSMGKANPIHEAAKAGNVKLIETLLAGGTSANEKDSRNGSSPLHWAALKDQKEVTTYLISKGADIDTKDQNGDTPLYWAIVNSNTNMVLLLLSKGANINVKNNNGSTPLHYANQYKLSKSVIDFLIAQGADVSIKDDRGLTALDNISKPDQPKNDQPQKEVQRVNVAVLNQALPTKQPLPIDIGQIISSKPYICIEVTHLYFNGRVSKTTEAYKVYEGYPAPNDNNWIRIVLDEKEYSAERKYFRTPDEVRRDILSPIKKADRNTLSFKGVPLGGRTFYGEGIHYDANKAYLLIHTYYLDKAETVRAKTALLRTTSYKSQQDMIAGISATDGESHYISANIEEGKYLKIEDDTLWEISPLDTINTALWLVMTDIVIVDGDDPVYPYKFINKDDDETANARRVISK